MPEYEDHQCPKCGCEEFIQKEQYELVFNYKSNSSGFYHKCKRNPNYFGKMFCDKCKKRINESESIKQGRIVLA